MWNAIALMTKCMLTVRTRDLSVRNSRLENENVVAFGAFAACYKITRLLESICHAHVEPMSKVVLTSYRPSPLAPH
jgi:hypothetical protein